MSSAPHVKRPDPAPRYEGDLYAWSLWQADLLRAGRLDELDAGNIAEELLDVGSSEYDKLESALRILLAHMLKWQYQPQKRSRSWENSIAIQRRHAVRQLSRSPSLKSRIGEAVEEAYFDAKRIASSETELDLEAFPEACPYDWDAIVNRPYLRAEVDGGEA
jgi:hypothetical protein